MCQLSDQFYAAVRTLSGAGPIKTRLAAAYDDYLSLLPAEELPKSIRPRFEQLWRAMHSVKPLGDESAVLASVRKMSTADANRYASQIVAMFGELVRVKDTGERLGQQKKSGQAPGMTTERYKSLN